MIIICKRLLFIHIYYAQTDSMSRDCSIIHDKKPGAILCITPNYKDITPVYLGASINVFMDPIRNSNGLFRIKCNRFQKRFVLLQYLDDAKRLIQVLNEHLTPQFISKTAAFM